MSSLLKDEPQDTYLADLKDWYEKSFTKGIIAEDDTVREADKKIASYLKSTDRAQIILG